MNNPQSEPLATPRLGRQYRSTTTSCVQLDAMRAEADRIIASAVSGQARDDNKGESLK